MKPDSISEDNPARIVGVTIGVVLVVAIIIPLLLAFAPADDQGDRLRSSGSQNSFGESSVAAILVDGDYTFTADSAGLHWNGQDYPASEVNLYAPEIPSGIWTLRPDGTSWVMGSAFVEGPYSQAVVTVSASGGVSVESWEGSSHGTSVVASSTTLLFMTSPWAAGDSGYATAALSPMSVPEGSPALLMSGESWNSTLAIASFIDGELVQNLRTVDATAEGSTLTFGSDVRVIGPVEAASGGGDDPTPGPTPDPDPDPSPGPSPAQGGVVWSMLLMLPVLLLVGLVLMSLPRLPSRTGRERRQDERRRPSDGDYGDMQVDCLSLYPF